jgi:hypothetical protein
MSAPRKDRRRTVRVAAHVHSAWSDDGSWTLPRIATVFARFGYDVILMSEHSRGFTAGKWQEYTEACRQASSDRVILVPGIEYGDEDDVVHVPVWGLGQFLGDTTPIGFLLPEVADAGGISVWAHPWRREAWRRFEPSWLDHLSAVEVWNRKYDGVAPSRDALALARREGLRSTVALDFHTRRQLFPLSLSLKIDDGPTQTAVCAALAAGRFAPRVLGLPLAPLVNGPGGTALQGLEVLRRAAARALH